MKYRTLPILVIFLVSLHPLQPVQADSSPQRTLDDAAALWYTSEVLLGGIILEEESSSFPTLMSPPQNPSRDDWVNNLIGAYLQAAKEMRNDLDANCKLLKAIYSQAGQDCEVERISATCEARRNEINAAIGEMHKLRGDRRKPLTKVWHSIKRTGRGFWHRIGPVGRNFLRQAGPEALKIVATGGTLSGGVIKNILKHTAKSMARNKIKAVVLKGVERLVQGQLDILEASGIDVCDPDQEKAADTEGQKPAAEEVNVAENYPHNAAWVCADVKGRFSTSFQPDYDWRKAKRLDYELTLLYSATDDSLIINYEYDLLISFPAVHQDGSVDWDDTSLSGKSTENNIPIDKYGIFSGTFNYTEIQIEPLGSVERARHDKYYGLIPPGDYSIAYFCEISNMEMPESLVHVTKENFQSTCPAHYYECALANP